MTQTTLISKPHYPILDGLRGVAALMVVAFHLLEAHAVSHQDQIINHGYLAVDFFFLLSGFVIGYAYEDRWGSMKVGSFMKRRLIRLQPMVILGMAIGAACFYFQESQIWPFIESTPVWKMLGIMVLGFFLLPVPPSLDIRGWNETYPLNGPGWSLFFEYIANIMYALLLRKLSTKTLTVLTFLAAAALVHYTTTNASGDIIGGWSLEPLQLRIGFTRVTYPFLAGLLLFRVSRLGQVQNAFLWSGLLLAAVLAMPRIGGNEHLWLNGLYDAASIIFLFPLIVYIGASGDLQTTAAKKINRFLGDISYPLYITHFPFIYIYTAWVKNHHVSLADGLPVAVLVFAGVVVLAYAALKFYDAPFRRWLGAKFLINS